MQQWVAKIAGCFFLVFAAVVCGSLFWLGTAVAEEGLADQQASKMQSSIAKIKDSLKEQDSTKDNLVKTGLSKWRENKEVNLSESGGRMIKGLGLCAGIFLIGVSVYQRLRGKGPASTGQRLHILERVSITPKSALVLAELDGQTILLSVGQERVSFHQQPGQKEVEQEEFEQSMDLVCKEEIRLSA